MNASFWLFTFDFALVFYVLGAAYLEGFVNYRTWHLIGAAEFRAYHRAVSPRIQAFLVVPYGLMLVLTCLLLWWRPGPIPQGSVWFSLMLNVVPVATSIVSQIPIQFEFDQKGLSLVSLERLIRMEWLRNLPHSLNALLFLWMMAKILEACSSCMGPLSACQGVKP